MKEYNYIIKCEMNKYYVGWCNFINERILEHFSGIGSNITKQYKPIEVLKIIENGSLQKENALVLYMMSKKGIDNVYGGIFCLTPKYIRKDINIILDKIKLYSLNEIFSLLTNIDCPLSTLKIENNYIQNICVKQNIFVKRAKIALKI
jgi:predicted GIY-YIG superfamily endonuclease